MKKLVLSAILGALIIMSFGIRKNNRHANPLTLSGTMPITLNGYTPAEASTMVAYCATTIDRKPVNTQIWFKKAIIDSINALLSYEKAHGPIVPDGIRIYFGRKSASVDTPIHKNNVIIIVSTYTLDTTIDHKLVKVHKDYFQHPTAAGLFHMGYIGGKILWDNDDANGARLYNTCDSCSVDVCPPTSPDDISRNEAELLAQRFKRKFLRTGKINSTAEWFNIKVIEDLFSNVGTQTAYDGVRIYFARGYAKGYTKNKAKFVLVQTTPGPNNTHIDNFDCRHHAKANKDAQDNGELCPTYCNGITLPQVSSKINLK